MLSTGRHATWGLSLSSFASEAAACFGFIHRYHTSCQASCVIYRHLRTPMPPDREGPRKSKIHASFAMVPEMEHVRYRRSYLKYSAKDGAISLCDILF